MEATSSLSSPTSRTQLQSLYLRSPLWDGFWLLSGFWLSFGMLLLPLAQVQTLLLPLTLGFWIAHRLSSVYVALCVVEYRTVLKKRRAYFFGLPALWLGFLMLFLLPPESVIPLSRFWRFALLGAADYFFSLYHFAVQHYGVLAMYRSRLPRSQHTRRLLRWDWWLCISVSGLFSVCMDLLYGEFEPLRLLYGGPWTTEHSVFKLILSLSVVLLWGLTLRRYRRLGQGPLRSLYVSSLCVMTLVSFYLPPLLYFALIQLQHWLVSLGLSVHMAHNSQGAKLADSTAWYRFWQRVNARLWGPLLTLLFLSLLLTPILEADHYILSNFDPESLSGGGFLQGFDGSLWLYVWGVLAFFSAGVHYLYDRGVYRLSDATTRSAALPLLRGRDG